MTQRQPGLFGTYVTDDDLHRVMPWYGAVVEGLVPSISGIGAGAGWTVTLGTSGRGVSVWRTKGDADHGCQTVEETEGVALQIDPPDANPRIDLILGLHKWVQGPVDGLTGEPTGEFTTSQQAVYAVLKGTPATEPEIPTVEDPYDGVGRHPVVLAAVRVAAEVDNVAVVERWDPTDWTHDRRGIPHVLTFEATNPDPGNDHAYTFGIVKATSELPTFDFDDLAVYISRTGYYHVLLTAEAADKICRIERKAMAETGYSQVHETVGRISAVLFFTAGDKVIFSGDSGAVTLAGSFVYLGFSDQEGELQDPGNSFTITNADISEYGEETFPYEMVIPITTTGDTPPIAWKILAGTDLPNAAFDGSDVKSTLVSYGAWTLKIYGKDSTGKTARKVIKILKLPSQIVVDTPAYLLLSGGTVGEAWDNIDGTGYGYGGESGFTRTFTITRSGGVGPYQYFGREPGSLLNPNVAVNTGVSTLFLPALPPQASNAEYNGQSTMTLTVTGAYGARTDKTVKAYAPRMHAKAGAATLYRRESPTLITLARPTTATFSILLATGSPADSNFQTGTHVWSVVGAGTTFAGAGVSAGTSYTSTFTADVPNDLGAYTFKTKAVVTVGSQTTTTEELFTVNLVPHGWLGLSWTLNTTTIHAGSNEHWFWATNPAAGPFNSNGGVVYHSSKFWVWARDFNGSPNVTSKKTRLFSTSDGSTWTLESPTGITLPTDPTTDRVDATLAKCGTTYVALVYNEAGPTLKFATSTDMLAWTEGADVLASGPRPLGQIAYNAGATGNKYAILSSFGLSGQGFFTSGNGRSWNSTPVALISGSTASDPSPYTRLGSDGVGWLAIANNKAAYTTDGTTWSTTSIPSGNWRGPIWTGASWVLVEYGGNRALTSPDAVTWTTRYLPSTKNWNVIEWTGESIFVAGQQAGGTGATQNHFYLMSTDGITWSQNQITTGGYYQGPFAVASVGGNVLVLCNNTLEDYGTPWGAKGISLISN
jgi:hypothetical protein